MKKKKAPVVNEKAPVVETAEVVEEKKGIVNCPKCSTALHVKVGDVAYLCPVCSQMFRTRIAERLVKDVTDERVVEAFVTVDKSVEGQVKTNTVITDKKA